MSSVEAIARAVLYEGYLLYPYGANSTKNRQRFTFGGLYPPAFDSSRMQAECLVEGDTRTELNVTLRFLQLLATGEAMERSIEAPRRIAVDGIQGEVTLARTPSGPGLFKVTVQVSNTTPVKPRDREEALHYSMLSTHVMLTVRNGAFVSLTDPPEGMRAAAAACQNSGCWPVLVGEPGNRDAMLASPIILEDYPRVAEESRQDFFDATEIDELLSLSIMSLSDEEKSEMRKDPKARQLLERTESMTADDLMRLHGVMRGMRLLQEDGP